MSSSLKIVTGPLQKAIVERLDSTVLSDGEVFTTALMAGAGKYADPEMTSFDQLRRRTQALGDDRKGKDPLDLDTIGRSTAASNPARAGKSVRSFAQSFSEYFRGNCKVLQWEQNSRIYE